MHKQVWLRLISFLCKVHIYAMVIDFWTLQGDWKTGDLLVTLISAIWHWHYVIHPDGYIRHFPLQSHQFKTETHGRTPWRWRTYRLRSCDACRWTIDCNAEEPKDLLGLMLKSTEHEVFTDQQVRDNVFVFFVAGHETTAGTKEHHSWLTR